MKGILIRREWLLILAMPLFAAWGGFDDIDTSRYMTGSDVNVRRNSSGDYVMIVKDETTRYHDQVANAMREWTEVGCDYDSSCPGVDIRPYTPGGHSPDVVVRESTDGQTFETAGKIVLSSTLAEDSSYEVVLHEFGHALGFKHFPTSYRCRTVMIGTGSCFDYSTNTRTPMMSPGDIDRSLYYHRWIKGDWDSKGVIVNLEASNI